MDTSQNTENDAQDEVEIHSDPLNLEAEPNYSPQSNVSSDNKHISEEMFVDADYSLAMSMDDESDEEAPVIILSATLSKMTQYYHHLNRVGLILNISIIGLPNIGNTCYANAVIQCLAATPGILQHFGPDILPALKESTTEVNANEYLLAVKFAYLLYGLHKGYFIYDQLQLFKKHFNKLCPEFDNTQEHDSNEFLEAFLELYKEYLNQVEHPDTTFEKQYPEEDGLDKYLEKFEENNRSSVVDQFVGTQALTRTCPDCSSVYNTFSSFSILRANVDVNSDFCDLMDCFPIYNEPDVGSWTCPKCGEEKQNVKAYTKIAKWPKVLVIHMNRVYSNRGFAGLSSCQVKFPDNNLDLSSISLGDDEDRSYSLYGIIDFIEIDNNSGHYVAYCRAANDRWFYFNDSDVRFLDSNWNFSKSLTYPSLLFYTCQSHSVNNSSDGQ